MKMVAAEGYAVWGAAMPQDLIPEWKASNSTVYVISICTSRPPTPVVPLLQDYAEGFGMHNRS
jgi:hypothetical protein